MNKYIVSVDGIICGAIKAKNIKNARKRIVEEYNKWIELSGRINPSTPIVENLKIFERLSRKSGFETQSLGLGSTFINR